MKQATESNSEAYSQKAAQSPKFRLHFVATFLIFFAGFAIALVIVQLVSMFTSSDPILTPFVPLFLVILGTYGVVFALLFGSIFRLLSSYRLTDEAFTLVSLGRKGQPIPWASIVKVESVVVGGFRTRLFRIQSESIKKNLYFLNWISRRKKFDALLLEFTQESNPMRQLTKSPSRPAVAT